MRTADYKRAACTFRTVRWEMMLLQNGVRCKWPVKLALLKLDVDFIPIDPKQVRSFVEFVVRIGGIKYPTP